MSLKLDYVRRQFPALAGDWIYMDNAGGSQILQTVVHRLQAYLLGANVQHGASYQPSQDAMAQVAAATAFLAEYIHAPHGQNVVMGPSTSMLIRILAHTMGQTFNADDEIIVSNVDHEANIGPWRELASRGVKIKEWRLNPDSLRLELGDLDGLLSEKTRLVAVTHCSNVLGTVHPIQEIADKVHAAGARLCVDGVAFAPHRPIDVQAWDVDFYVFSFYKVYGPHYALLYGKEDLLLDLPSFNHFFIGKDQVPYKFQPGNVNFELASSMLGLKDYIADYDSSAEGFKENRIRFFNDVKAHETQLAERLLALLRSKSGVRIIGEKVSDGQVRVPTISFISDRWSSDALTLETDKAFIGIRFGDFYARRLIDDLGLDHKNGVVRVSLVHYNTVEEVDRLVAVLDPLL